MSEREGGREGGREREREGGGGKERERGGGRREEESGRGATCKMDVIRWEEIT